MTTMYNTIIQILLSDSHNDEIKGFDWLAKEIHSLGGLLRNDCRNTIPKDADFHS